MTSRRTGNLPNPPSRWRLMRKRFVRIRPLDGEEDAEGRQGETRDRGIRPSSVKRPRRQEGMGAKIEAARPAVAVEEKEEGAEESGMG